MTLNGANKKKFERDPLDKAKRQGTDRIMSLKPWQNLAWLAKLYPNTKCGTRSMVFKGSRQVHSPGTDTGKVHHVSASKNNSAGNASK